MRFAFRDAIPLCNRRGDHDAEAFDNLFRVGEIILRGSILRVYLLCLARESGGPARARGADAEMYRGHRRGKESDCALVKAKDEWILWMNSDSKPRSIHFKSDDNPFTEASCWDVAPGARARSGPVALNAALKTYVSYTSDAPCSANPPPDNGRGTAKVTVQ